MLALSDVIDLGANEFARLRGSRLPLARILLSPMNSLDVRHHALAVIGLVPTLRGIIPRLTAPIRMEHTSVGRGP